MTPTRYLNQPDASFRFGDLADVYAASLMRADPPADALVEALHARTSRPWWSVVLDALDHGVDAVEDAPPELGVFLDSLAPLPSEEEWSVIDEGVAAVARTGEGAGIALQCAALLVDYRSSAFSKALVLTGHLQTETGTRLARTAAWWIEAHKPGGLRSEQDGFKTTLHVRLIHAWVRRMALHSGRWDSDSWGLPINQGDLFFQLVGFTFLLVRSLKRMGFSISQHDSDAYYATWRYIGRVLGIDAELLPLINERDCSRFWQLWFLTNPGPDANRALLAEATLKALATSLEKGWMADHVNYPLLCGMSYWLLGEQVCDGLQIPKTRWASVLPRTYRPAVQLYELGNRIVPGDRSRVVAKAVQTLMTGNQAMGILPMGTQVVVEPDRLRNAEQFVPVVPGRPTQ